MITRAVNPAAEFVLASEVLELGQSLFDTIIEAAAQPVPSPEQETSFPEDEVRAAADAFFATLRVLLGLESVERSAGPA